MSWDETLERLFLREKPVLALLAVGEMRLAYAALVAKRIDSTFPHTSSILSQLEAQGMIKSRPEGRVRYLELTDRGRKTAAALSRLRDLLKEPQGQWKKLEQLKDIIRSDSGQNPAFRLGPLRRDLFKFKSADDEELRLAAEELDALIVKAIRSG